MPILDALLPVLSAWKLKSGGKGRVIPPLRRDGTKVDKHTPGRFLRATLEHLGLARVGLGWYEATRHTFASHWVLSGGSIEKLKEMLGHYSVLVTERYAHLKPDLFSAKDMAVLDLALAEGDEKPVPLVTPSTGASRPAEGWVAAPRSPSRSSDGLQVLGLPTLRRREGPLNPKTCRRVSPAHRRGPPWQPLDHVTSDRMALLKRVLALLAGWALVFWGLAMAGGGHAFWQAFGARTIYVGLLEALALVIVGDALLIGLLVARAGEKSKVVIGFFAVAGLLVSLGAFGAIRHAWQVGM